MLTLFKSKKFQEDYTRYQKSIANIPEGPVRAEAIALLTKLVNIVKTIDQNISEVTATNQMAANMTDLRVEISAVRKQLDSKLRDWAEAQPD